MVLKVWSQPGGWFCCNNIPLLKTEIWLNSYPRWLPIPAGGTSPISSQDGALEGAVSDVCLVTRNMKFPCGLHPGRLIWTIIMEVWMIIFLSKWVICRFHVNLPGCMGFPITFSMAFPIVFYVFCLVGFTTRWAPIKEWLYMGWWVITLFEGCPGCPN